MYSYLCTLILLGLAVVSASSSRLSIGDAITCTKQKDTALCDDLDDCTWCVNSKLGTGCYPLAVAKKLPTKLFTCDKMEEAAVRQEPEVACVMRTEDKCVDECVWCEAGALGGGCFSESQAKLLPESMFKCATLRAEA